MRKPEPRTALSADAPDGLFALAIDDARLAELTALHAAAAEPRPVFRVALAWHLRQRETRRSVALLDEVQTALETASPQWLQRADLVRAEAAWLSADLDAARALLTPLLEPVAGGAIGCDACSLMACVAHDRGDLPASMAWIEQARSRARHGGDAQRLAVAEGMQAFWTVTADPAQAQARWGDLMAKRSADPDPLVALWSALFRGLLHGRRSEFVEAIAQFATAAELASSVGHLRRAIAACANVSAGYTNLNDHSTALHWSHRALDLARLNEWPLSVGMCLSELTLSFRRLNRMTEARQAVDEALAVLRPLKGSGTLMAVMLHAANQTLAEGDVARALAEFEAICRQGSPAEPPVLGGAHLGRAKALLQMGRTAAAAEAAQLAVTHARASRYKGSQFLALAQLGEVQARRDEPPPPGHTSAALTTFDQALELAGSISGFAVPPSLWDSIATERARCGDLGGAYGAACQARQARERSDGVAAAKRAAAMAARLETERARNERERLRAQAEQARNQAEWLQATHGMLEQLGRIGQEITSQLDIDRVFGGIYQHLQALLEAPHLSIWLTDPDTRSLHRVFGMQGDRRLHRRSVSIDAPASDVARCLRDGAEVVREAADDPSEVHVAPGTARPLTSLCGPLRVRDRVLGVISIRSTTAMAYGERERLIFGALCAFGAIALDNAAVYRQIDAARVHLLQAGAREREAREQALLATRLKSEFLAGVSHALRRPVEQLRESLASVQVDGPGPSSEIDRQRLQLALIRSSDVNRLARDLLDLARLESGSVLPVLESFSMRELCHDVLQKRAQLAVERGSQVAARFSPGHHLVVADIGMIEKVLTTLIDVAIRHGEVGHEIVLRLQPERGRLLVSLAYRGIPPEGLPVRETGGAPDDGVPWGLSMARQMLRLHHGDLHFRFDPTAGSRFAFELPGET